MVESPIIFAAFVLLLAGVFPAAAARSSSRLFDLVPPIVMSYVLTMVLAVAGCWRASEGIAAVQSLTVAHLLPALVFLLLVRCDLRAVAHLGPRVLLAFACATLSILGGITVAWLLWCRWLPVDGWQVLAPVGAGWVGGTSNLVAVSHAIAAPPDAVSLALATDTVCYTAWVMILFGSVPLAPRFNRWARAAAVAPPAPGPAALARPTAAGDVLVWLGLSLLAGAAAAAVAARLPTDGPLTATSWTLLLATVAGAAVAMTPLGRLPGADAVSSALLAVVVVTVASQGSFAGLSRAPACIAAGATALAFHAAAMVLAAKVLRLDLAICGIASLANVGGVASAPLLAAAHAPGLAPVGVLLALLGYFLGTAAGLGLAALLPALGRGGG